MIRHFAATAAIALSAGVLSSCSQSGAPADSAAPDPVAQTENSALVNKATTLVDNVMAGDYGAVVATFDATMTEALPEDKLAQTMAQLDQQVGAFRERTDTRQTEEAGYDVVYVTTVFEKATLNAKVAYDSEGKVAGLFFQP